MFLKTFNHDLLIFAYHFLAQVSFNIHFFWNCATGPRIIHIHNTPYSQYKNNHFSVVLSILEVLSEGIFRFSVINRKIGFLNNCALF